MENSLDSALKQWFKEGFGERPGFRDPEITWAKQMRSALQPKNIAASLFAGTVTSILAAVVAIGYAALIFSGELAQFEQNGIGYLLFGGMVVALVSALISSQYGVLAGIHDTGVAVMSLAGVALVAELPADTPPDVLLITMTVTMMASTILAGLFFFFLGQVKLGNLIRYIPFPVIGGFMSGSGVLVFRGSFSVMGGVPFSLDLLQPDVMIKWLPGLAFMLIAFFGVRRIKNFLAMPTLIAGSVIVFYLVAAVMGVQIETLNEAGWLLSISPQGGLWQPLTPVDFQHVDWAFIGRHVGNIIAVGFAVLISLLAQASGIEIVLERDLDLNHELKMMGLINMVTGLGGSTPGAHYLASTALAKDMNASTRLVGVVQAAILAVILFAGGSFLFYLPRFVVGGLLMYVGMLFIYRWVFQAWRELPLGEYAIILLILGGIYFFGFIPGVSLGIASAVVLFVVSYSQVDIIRNHYTGLDQYSSVERPILHRDLLQGKGHWLYMLKLQGFIFFGSANRVFKAFKERIEDETRPQPHFFLIDFTDVTGVDSSAMQSFQKIVKLAQKHDIKLIFTAVSEVTNARLHQEPFLTTENTVWVEHPHLDRGLEWYEEQVLAEFDQLIELDRPETMTEHLQQLFETQAEIDLLMSFFDVLELDVGEPLLVEGTKTDAIYFIEQGRVQVTLRLTDEESLQLRILNPGTIVGEIGVYLDTDATASARAMEPTTLFRISTKRLSELEQQHPHLAIVFHRFMAKVVARRLVDTSATMKMLS